MPQILTERPCPDRTANGDASRQSVTMNLAESPLTWLAARGLVTARQSAAGEVLRRDFEKAQLGPRITMRWEACPKIRHTPRRVRPSGRTCCPFGRAAAF